MIIIEVKLITIISFSKLLYTYNCCIIIIISYLHTVKFLMCWTVTCFDYNLNYCYNARRPRLVANHRYRLMTKISWNCTTELKCFCYTTSIQGTMYIKSICRFDLLFVSKLLSLQQLSQFNRNWANILNILFNAHLSTLSLWPFSSRR